MNCWPLARRDRQRLGEVVGHGCVLMQPVADHAHAVVGGADIRAVIQHVGGDGRRIHHVVRDATRLADNIVKCLGVEQPLTAGLLAANDRAVVPLLFQAGVQSDVGRVLTQVLAQIGDGKIHFAVAAFLDDLCLQQTRAVCARITHVLTHTFGDVGCG